MIEQVRNKKYFPEDAFKHPVLAKLSDLVAGLVGIRFLIVFPKKEGWGQVAPGDKPEIPRFCKLIQSTPEGVKHCRMCHVLMTVAASSKGLTEQKCHAGATVLVSPIPADEEGECLGVLGTCTFRMKGCAEGWNEVRERGRQLGVNLKELKKACRELPQLNPEELELGKAIFAAAADAVQEIKARTLAESRLEALEGLDQAKSEVEESVEHELRESLSSTEGGDGDSKDASNSKVPVLIRVVSDLIDRKPNMPFNVAEIAAAARITPNHFSTLFHICMGQSFLSYLTEKRIEMAKQLLRDLTLNVTEVAGMVGYTDPSYFVRRFKHMTGKTPLEYRNSLMRRPVR